MAHKRAKEPRLVPTSTGNMIILQTNHRKMCSDVFNDNFKYSVLGKSNLACARK